MNIVSPFCTSIRFGPDNF